MSAQKGRLLGIGVGPGDPELITLKALRLLQSAAVVGYFVAKAKANKGHGGNAFGIIEQHLTDTQQRLPLVYPVTTEKLAAPLSYEDVISDFYDTCAVQIAARLDAGQDLRQQGLGGLQQTLALVRTQLGQGVVATGHQAFAGILG